MLPVKQQDVMEDSTSKTLTVPATTLGALAAVTALVCVLHASLCCTAELYALAHIGGALLSKF
jgi:hypothetical protein